MEHTNIGRPGSEKPNRHNTGRVIGGIVLLMVGMAIMLRQLDVDMPYWLFSWPMILVVIGLYIGGRDAFKPGGWMVVALVGVVFLVEDVLDDYDMDFARYFWPLIIISIGLYMIFKPRQRKSYDNTIASDDYFNSTAIFGGTKNNVISKNFKGGEISTFFGGTDLNLSQADFQGSVVIHSTTAFGGVNIIAPANWNIKSEVVFIFGGMEDKRPQPNGGTDLNKTLVLKGTCIFGGVDVKSF